MQVGDRLAVALTGHNGRRVVVALVNVRSWLMIALHVGLVRSGLRNESVRVSAAVVRRDVELSVGTIVGKAALLNFPLVTDLLQTVNRWRQTVGLDLPFSLVANGNLT